MAKKPQKEGVEGAVKKLMETEVSGIQEVARDMAERVKQLEEHSLRIKQYTEEIEKLAAESALDKYETTNLDDLVKNLEKTLARLRKKQVEPEATIEPVRAKSGIEVSEPKQTARERLAMRRPVEEEPEEEEEETIQAPKTKFPEYTTPEGFVLRKIR